MQEALIKSIMSLKNIYLKKKNSDNTFIFDL